MGVSLLKFGNVCIKIGSDLLFVVTSDITEDYQLVETAELAGTYSDGVLCGFLFKPKHTVEAEVITVYGGRNRTGSNSNVNGSIGVCYVFDYNSSDVGSSSLRTAGEFITYTSASLYGYANGDSSKAEMWFTDVDGGAYDSKGSNADASTGVGLHNVCSVNSVSVGDVTLYEYKIKRADGAKFKFVKGKYYGIGFYPCGYNGSADQVNTLALTTAGNDDNCIYKYSYSDSKIQAKYTGNLPYFLLDGKVYTDFDRSGSTPSTDIEFTNGSWSTTSYNSISDILASLGTSDTLAIFVRHAERGDVTGKGGGLTDNGILQAQSLGTAIETATSETYLYGESTEILRTLQTVYYAASSMGSTQYSEPTYDSSTDTITTDIPTTTVFGGSVYTTDTDWNTVSAWVSNEENHTAIKNVSQTILKHILESCSKKINLFVSHDTVLVPMIGYATSYALVPTASDWCGYLHGVAIIKRSTGDIEIAPLNCLTA